jgi:uncharacterized protein (DUF2336 family)
MSTDVGQFKAMQAQSQTAGMVLTEADVRRLLDDSTPQARIDITNKLALAYGGAKMNKNESVIAEQIFRLLMRDLEVRVRASLAQNIKESTAIPKDIVMALAKDVEEVSLPVLQSSQVLDDNDLVELIQSTKEISRHLAISMRKEVSGEVAETLLKGGNDKVAMSLINNEGAHISEAGLDTIIKTFSGDETMMGAVSKRPQLPVGAVEKLINVVSSTIAEELKKKYKSAPLPVQSNAIQQEVEKVKETETLSMASASMSQEEVEKLISQLIAYDRLSPSIILRSLCQGNFNFFETSLARLANIPVSNARTLINDRGELGFRGVYNKSGLPEAMFPAVKLLNRVVHELRDEGEKPGTSQFANRIVERILHYSEEQPVENMSYIIALVRRVAE